MALLKRALADSAELVARNLLGPPNFAMSSKSELRFGKKGSLAVVIAGAKKGYYYDHEAGLGGDLLHLTRREMKVGFREALAIAERLVGGVRHALARQTRISNEDAVERRTPDTNRREALNLWADCVPIQGTIAQRYLASRGIHVLSPEVQCTLRFHPAGPFGSSRIPMLVALYRGIQTNEPCAVHRTGLSAVGKKVARKCLGSKKGAAIKLSPDEHVAQGLIVGEGIETTLSAMMLGLCPAWALGDAGAIGNFPLLPGVSGLTILVDNDATGAGQTQAGKCRDRWIAAGCEVVTLEPDQTGDDINDLLRNPE